LAGLGVILVVFIVLWPKGLAGVIDTLAAKFRTSKNKNIDMQSGQSSRSS